MRVHARAHTGGVIGAEDAEGVSQKLLAIGYGFFILTVLAAYTANRTLQQQLRACHTLVTHLCAQRACCLAVAAFLTTGSAKEGYKNVEHARDEGVHSLHIARILQTQKVAWRAALKLYARRHVADVMLCSGAGQYLRWHRHPWHV